MGWLPILATSHRLAGHAEWWRRWFARRRFEECGTREFGSSAKPVVRSFPPLAAGDRKAIRQPNIFGHAGDAEPTCCDAASHCLVCHCWNCGRSDHRIDDRGRRNRIAWGAGRDGRWGRNWRAYRRCIGHDRRQRCRSTGRQGSRYTAAIPIGAALTVRWNVQRHVDSCTCSYAGRRAAAESVAIRLT